VIGANQEFRTHRDQDSGKRKENLELTRSFCKDCQRDESSSVEAVQTDGILEGLAVAAAGLISKLDRALWHKVSVVGMPAAPQIYFSMYA
jgi:hypothetical protein